jgi:hypothetical protein
MATGNYGIKKLSDVTPDDMQIFYSFQADRETPATQYEELNANQLITESNDINGNLFQGLYQLQLPTSTFNQRGIYTIVVKPREYTINITDCGVLSAIPDIKGVVLDSAVLPQNLGINNSLVGYRIEYFDSVSGLKTRNLFRIITSSNRCEPVNQNLTNTIQKAIRYRLTDSGSLIFCTLTPSSSSQVKPNILPFIGEPGQQIVLSNTFFDPVVLEVELVEHDFNTLANGLFGNQIKDIKNGIYTIYDENNNIYKQYSLYVVQSQNDEPLYEVREENGVIDTTQDFNTITNV